VMHFTPVSYWARYAMLSHLKEVGTLSIMPGVAPETALREWLQR
jgi:hypothetical protein